MSYDKNALDNIDIKTDAYLAAHGLLPFMLEHESPTTAHAVPLSLRYLSAAQIRRQPYAPTREVICNAYDEDRYKATENKETLDFTIVQDRDLGSTIVTATINSVLSSVFQFEEKAGSQDRTGNTYPGSVLLVTNYNTDMNVGCCYKIESSKTESPALIGTYGEGAKLAHLMLLKMGGTSHVVANSYSGTYVLGKKLNVPLKKNPDHDRMYFVYENRKVGAVPPKRWFDNNDQQHKAAEAARNRIAKSVTVVLAFPDSKPDYFNPLDFLFFYKPDSDLRKDSFSSELNNYNIQCELLFHPDLVGRVYAKNVFVRKEESLTLCGVNMDSKKDRLVGRDRNREEYDFYAPLFFQYLRYLVAKPEKMGGFIKSLMGEDVPAEFRARNSIDFADVQDDVPEFIPLLQSVFAKMYPGRMPIADRLVHRDFDDPDSLMPAPLAKTLFRLKYHENRRPLFVADAFLLTCLQQGNPFGEKPVQIEDETRRPAVRQPHFMYTALESFYREFNLEPEKTLKVVVFDDIAPDLPSWRPIALMSEKPTEHVFYVNNRVFRWDSPALGVALISF